MNQTAPSSPRWNKRGIPRTGWTFLRVRDIGDRSGQCGMCDTAIRYAHIIVHPKFGELEVGCRCSEKLTKKRESVEDAEAKTVRARRGARRTQL